MKLKYKIIFVILIITGALILFKQILYVKYKQWYFYTVDAIKNEKQPYAWKIVPISKFNYTASGETFVHAIPLEEFENPFKVEFEKVSSAEKEITINVVGDIIPHGDVQLSAFINRDYNNGRCYGYDWLFRNVAEKLSKADITIGNLETSADDGAEFSGTKYGFNVSSYMIGALRQAGFDILLTANNHSLDFGEKSYEATINNILSYKIIPLGFNNDSRELTSYSGVNFVNGMVNLKGFKIGMINYTFFSNKEVDSSSVGLNICNTKDCNIIKNRSKFLKQNGADFIILFLHWGREYNSTPTYKQRKLANQLFDSGIDAIIGGHSHFIQPMEVISIVDKIMNKKECFVAYSLGNFISHQRGGCKFGMMLKLILSKNKNGVFLKKVNVEIVKTNMIPCEYYYNSKIYSYNIFESSFVELNEFEEYLKKYSSN
jgi:poly-gamma-glutamate capsule biosynthesis protein CapA/YwtB (metallophosphatase superfamily)